MLEYNNRLVTVCGLLKGPPQHSVSVYRIGVRSLLYPHSEPADIFQASFSINA